MAGYVVNGPGKHVPFRIGTPDLAKKIMDSSESKKVVLLQLDCDELDAALWGLENARKAGFEYTTGKDDLASIVAQMTSGVTGSIPEQDDADIASDAYDFIEGEIVR